MVARDRRSAYQRFERFPLRVFIAGATSVLGSRTSSAPAGGRTSGHRASQRWRSGGLRSLDRNDGDIVTLFVYPTFLKRAWPRRYSQGREASLQRSFLQVPRDLTQLSC